MALRITHRVGESFILGNHTVTVVLARKGEVRLSVESAELPRPIDTEPPNGVDFQHQRPPEGD